MLTIISWCTPSYKYLANGLRQDCQRLGYRFHLYEIEREYSNLVKAWCNHPEIIKRGVEEFGTILFLDVECRIIRPIPAHWQAPLVSMRNPAQGFWITYNTGTVMADPGCFPWLNAWIRIIKDWDMANLSENTYIHWPNDICDELAFHAAVSALDVKLNTPLLEYLDRSSRAEIARGLWKNKYTVIQHPTLQHWIKEKNPEECKKLFVQNYPANIAQVYRILPKSKQRLELNGWTFDPESRMYAPNEYWKNHKRQWIEDTIVLSAGQH